MGKSEQRLGEDRSVRNSARAVFDAGVAQVKGDLAARSVGGRVLDAAIGEVRGAVAEGLAVARESKGIAAGTIAALALWFLRGPILARFGFGSSASEPAAVQADPAMDDEDITRQDGTA